MTAKSVYPLAIFICLTALFLGCDAEKISNPAPQPPQLAPFEITVTHIHDQIPGHYANVSIYADSSRGRLGGYDLFLSYDPNALTFISADPGDLLKAEAWDLFDYQRYSGGQIDSSHLAFVHVYAVNDIPNVEIPPDNSVPPSDELAALEFFVNNEYIYECTFQAIRFYWRDCDDNVLYTLTGDTVAFVENAYDTARSVEVADSIYIDGWHGPSEDCFTALHHVPVPMIDFINGGIDIYCTDSVVNYGDINDNGLPWEIADAVMFINYFVYGLAAFGQHVEASTAVSDVNIDGNTLTVADLVFLIRVIQGDVWQLPSTQDTASMTVSMNYHTHTETVTTQSDSTIGAIYMVFDTASITGPPSLGPGAYQMNWKYNVVNDSLRVIIFSIGNNAIPSGIQTVLTIPTSDAIPLLYFEAATFSGIPMKATRQMALVR